MDYLEQHYNAFVSYIRSNISLHEYFVTYAKIGELIHFVITFADAKKDVVDSLLRASGCLDYSVHRILVQIPAQVKYARTLQSILAMRNCHLLIFLQASTYCTLPLQLQEELSYLLAGRYA